LSESPGSPLLDQPLLAILEQARELGYLGPGPIERHIEHACGFAEVIERRFPDVAQTSMRFVDLGSGGGVPGLVLLRRWPESWWCFLDTNQRRMATLRDALATLEVSHRSEVICGRAEEESGRPGIRGTVNGVVARGFGPPAVTAECAAPLLAVGGVFVVSEPPEERARWDVAGLATLGLRGDVTMAGGFRFFDAVQEVTCPPRFPRRVGIPGKRPLFE
jgi:16S rRNA (guanine527-N7)-methyltransferase